MTVATTKVVVVTARNIDSYLMIVTVFSKTQRSDWKTNFQSLMFTKKEMLKIEHSCHDIYKEHSRKN